MRYLKQNGNVFAARYRLSAIQPAFEGLPAPPDADFSLRYSGGSLSEWKQRLGVGERGDDWEKAFETGQV